MCDELGLFDEVIVFSEVICWIVDFRGLLILWVICFVEVLG